MEIVTGGTRIAIISDVHGDNQVLSHVLEYCESSGVDELALLGDLIDRPEQARSCLELLSGWIVFGVAGNHDREALAHLGQSEPEARSHVQHLLEMLGDELHTEEARFVHQEFEWKTMIRNNGRQSTTSRWLTFAGHTHYRAARDDNGPIDLSIGRIHLRRHRRYLINPGAAVEGQFAIWDRSQETVHFKRV
jgi:predicted phosphodiesterase